MDSIETSPTADRSTSNYFFLAATVALLSIVLIGFAPSLYMRFAFVQPPIPIYLHLHGIILTGWFVVLVLQASLVRTGNTAVHRKFGYFFAAYAAVVVGGGLMATLTTVPRSLAAGMTFDSNMADLDPAMGGSLTYLAFISGVVWANIQSVIGFATLVALAVVFRRKTDIHKRLIIIATIGLLPPALARIARAEFLGGEQGPFLPIALLSLLAAVSVHDKLSTGRFHPASVLASIYTLVLGGLGTWVAQTEFGLSFVRSLGGS